MKTLYTRGNKSPHQSAIARNAAYCQQIPVILYQISIDAVWVHHHCAPRAHLLIPWKKLWKVAQPEIDFLNIVPFAATMCHGVQKTIPSHSAPEISVHASTNGPPRSTIAIGCWRNAKSRTKNPHFELICLFSVLCLFPGFVFFPSILSLVLQEILIVKKGREICFLCQKSHEHFQNGQLDIFNWCLVPRGNAAAESRHFCSFLHFVWKWKNKMLHKGEAPVWSFRMGFLFQRCASMQMRFNVCVFHWWGSYKGWRERGPCMLRHPSARPETQSCVQKLALPDFNFNVTFERYDFFLIAVVFWNKLNSKVPGCNIPVQTDDTWWVCNTPYVFVIGTW